MGNRSQAANRRYAMFNNRKVRNAVASGVCTLYGYESGQVEMRGHRSKCRWQKLDIGGGTVRVIGLDEVVPPGDSALREHAIPDTSVLVAIKVLSAACVLTTPIADEPETASD